MKPLEDRGHALAITKPVQIRRFDAQRLPDPGACTDCLIVINDRSNQSRARLALSDGASWVPIGTIDDAMIAPAVDVSGIASEVMRRLATDQAAVLRRVAALEQRPQALPVAQQPALLAPPTIDIDALSGAIGQVFEAELTALRSRIEALERTLASVAREAA